MSWFHVDDGWWSHPKTVGVSFAARGLWVTAGSWCGQHLTDGIVPKKMLRVWGASAKLAQELVACGLWLVKDDEHWFFHDWPRYNSTRETTLEKRARDAERKRESRGSPRGRPNGLRTESGGSPDGFREESARSPSGSRCASSPDPVLSDPNPEREARAHEAGRPSGVRADTPDSEESQPGECDSFALRHPGCSGPVIADRLAAELAERGLMRWDALAHYPGLAAIAQKPVAEIELVVAAVLADPWCQANPGRVTPAHLAKHWPRYARGPSANGNGRRELGPAPVSSAEAFARDAENNPSWASED